MMQICIDQLGEHREIRLGRDDASPQLQFACRVDQKIGWAPEVMEHVCECDHIQALVCYCVEAIDRMAVEDVVEIVQIQHIAGNNILIKQLQGRSSATDLKDTEIGRVEL